MDKITQHTFRFVVIMVLLLVGLLFEAGWGYLNYIKEKPKIPIHAKKEGFTKKYAVMSDEEDAMFLQLQKKNILQLFNDKEAQIRIAYEDSLKPPPPPTPVQPPPSVQPTRVEPPKQVTRVNPPSPKPVNPPQTTPPKNPYTYVMSRVKSGLFYLDIPKINVHQFWVQQGTGDEQAQLAVGGALLEGTPIPFANINANQNSVIGGHRTGYGSPLYNINKLEAGDLIQVHINGRTLKYIVMNHFIVQQEEGYAQVVSPIGSNTLTIYSCDDGNGGAGRAGTVYRYVVRAKITSVQ